MTTLTYRITTLGCRVNHAEAREMASVLLARGLVAAPAKASADVEIIHTCSVTSAAAAKSRRAVRRAGRRTASRPDRRQIMVTGCDAEADPEEARHLAEEGLTLVPHEAADGSSLIDRLAAHIDRWLASWPALQPIRRNGQGSSPPGVEHHLPVFEPRAGSGSHVRAELKIQDGCDAHCTFCIIPSLRRSIRSKSLARTVQEARQLVDLGHQEIVLTGIFLGAYGFDTALRRRQVRDGGHPLADLVDAVARIPGLRRLRLSSLEPGDVDEPLVDAMVAHRRVVVPHLHLPLQSGSDRVLRRMNRQYGVEDYLEMIQMVRERLTQPGPPAPLPPAITTDIMCGFPGETEADFEQTADVARRVGYLHLHVFPFSARPGTAAARWRDQHVPEPVKRRRVQRLLDLEHDPAEGLSIRFRRRLLGRTVRVILEQPDRIESGIEPGFIPGAMTGVTPGVMTGRCDHYALISVRTDAPRGTLLDVVVTDVTSSRTIGVPAGVERRLPVLAAR